MIPLEHGEPPKTKSKAVLFYGESTDALHRRDLAEGEPRHYP